MKSPLLLTVIFIITSYGFVYTQTKGACTPAASVAVTNQTNYKEDLKTYYQNYQNGMGNEFDGSYQFIISGNEKLLVTSETLDFITQNRDKNNQVVIDLTSYIKVRILPAIGIKSKKFDRIKEMFIVSTN